MGQACSPNELGEKLLKGGFLLLDVRTPEEVAIAAIDGATNIPLDELEKRVGELGQWLDGEVVVMCHHGIRSAMASKWLRMQGFKTVLNLSGGIDAYAHTVDTTIPRY